MTLMYTYGCDVCAMMVHIPIDKDPKKLPEGWSHVTVDCPDGTHRDKHLCAACTKAMQDGIPVVRHSGSRVVAWKPEEAKR